MRKLSLLLSVAALLGGVSLAATASEDKPETKIIGDGVCAKCALGETKTCQNVVIVKEEGKEVKYYLVANDVAKKAHSSMGFCSAKQETPAKVVVVGTVAEKDGKKQMTATEIKKQD